MNFSKKANDQAMAEWLEGDLRFLAQNHLPEWQPERRTPCSIRVASHKLVGQNSFDGVCGPFDMSSQDPGGCLLIPVERGFP